MSVFYRSLANLVKKAKMMKELRFTKPLYNHSEPDLYFNQSFVEQKLNPVLKGKQAGIGSLNWRPWSKLDIKNALLPDKNTINQTKFPVKYNEGGMCKNGLILQNTPTVSKSAVKTFPNDMCDFDTDYREESDTFDSSVPSDNSTIHTGSEVKIVNSAIYIESEVKDYCSSPESGKFVSDRYGRRMESDVRDYMTASDGYKSESARFSRKINTRNGDVYANERRLVNIPKLLIKTDTVKPNEIATGLETYRKQRSPKSQLISPVLSGSLQEKPGKMLEKISPRNTHISIKPEYISSVRSPKILSPKAKLMSSALHFDKDTGMLQGESYSNYINQNTAREKKQLARPSSRASTVMLNHHRSESAISNLVPQDLEMKRGIIRYNDGSTGEGEDFEKSSVTDVRSGASFRRQDDQAWLNWYRMKQDQERIALQKKRADEQKQELNRKIQERDKKRNEEIEKRNFQLWIQRKQQEIERKKFLEERKRLREERKQLIEERKKTAEKMKLDVWLKEKEHQLKEKKAKETEAKKLKEEELRRREEKSRHAYEQWKKKAVHRPKPMPGGIITKKSGYQPPNLYLNPVPWKPPTDLME